jgi:hypothetical protein
MKISLEEERRALLEEIEARRALYRRMLSGESEDYQTPNTHKHAVGRPIPQHHNRIGEWVRNHPLQMATGVALLLWLVPRLIQRNQARSRTVMHAPAAGQATGILKTIAGVMMILLRDPRQLQTTASMFGSVWRWLRRVTTAQTHNQRRKTHA